MRSIGLRLTALLMLLLLAAGAQAALIKIDFSCIELSEGVVGWTGPGPMPTCVDLSYTVDTLSYTSSSISYPGYLSGEIGSYHFYEVNVLAASATANGTDLPIIGAGLPGEFGGDDPGFTAGFCFCYGLAFSYDAAIPPTSQLGDDPLAAILLAQSGAGSFAGASGEWGYFNAFGILQMSAVPAPPAVWLFGSALGLMGAMRRKIAA